MATNNKKTNRQLTGFGGLVFGAGGVCLCALTVWGFADGLAGAQCRIR